MTFAAETFASLFDSLAAREDARGAAALRELLVADVEGDVLEIGTGTGRCLPYYRRARAVVAIEPDAAMRQRAVRRAADVVVPTSVVPGDAMELAFPAASFDTVVAAWVLCTVPDLVQVLAEVRRVLRPDGTLRFVEHVRSTDRRLASWQERLAGPWRFIGRGCRCNQETATVLRDCGFTLDPVATFDFEPSSPAIVRPTILGVGRPTDQ
jgi:ubiquinone/menaquinone biosynthesis C-methylase UbiE